MKSAAVASNIPLDLNYNSNNIYVEGQPLERGTNLPTAMVASASPNYFATMGTSVSQGREFTDRDTQNSELVAVVNETFVSRLIPDAGSSAGAIGRRISFNAAKGPFVRIVGVVRDGKYFNISEEPRSFVWAPLTQSYASTATLVVRTTGDPQSVISSARSEIRKLDPNLPLYDVKTLKDHMRLSLFPARVAETLNSFLM